MFFKNLWAFVKKKNARPTNTVEQIPQTSAAVGRARLLDRGRERCEEAASQDLQEVVLLHQFLDERRPVEELHTQRVQPAHPWQYWSTTHNITAYVGV